MCTVFSGRSRESRSAMLPVCVARTDVCQESISSFPSTHRPRATVAVKESPREAVSLSKGDSLLSSR